jgi:hypothetical protein
MDNNATQKQIAFLKILIDRAGYDENDYDFGSMTREEASETIDELKDELGYLDDDED